MGLPETGCAVASIRGAEISVVVIGAHRAVRVAGYDCTDVGEELTADRRVPDRDRVRVDVHAIAGGPGKGNGDVIAHVARGAIVVGNLAVSEVGLAGLQTS